MKDNVIKFGRLTLVIVSFFVSLIVCVVLVGLHQAKMRLYNANASQFFYSVVYTAEVYWDEHRAAPSPYAGFCMSKDFLEIQAHLRDSLGTEFSCVDSEGSSEQSFYRVSVELYQSSLPYPIRWLCARNGDVVVALRQPSGASCEK